MVTTVPRQKRVAEYKTACCSLESACQQWFPPACVTVRWPLHFIVFCVCVTMTTGSQLLLLSPSVYVIVGLNLKVSFVSLLAKSVMPCLFLCMLNKWKTVKLSLLTKSKPEANGITWIVQINTTVQDLKEAKMVTPTLFNSPVWPVQNSDEFQRVTMGTC